MYNLHILKNYNFQHQIQNSEHITQNQTKNKHTHIHLVCPVQTNRRETKKFKLPRSQVV